MSFSLWTVRNDVYLDTRFHYLAFVAVPAYDMRAAGAKSGETVALQRILRTIQRPGFMALAAPTIAFFLRVQGVSEETCGRISLIYTKLSQTFAKVALLSMCHKKVSPTSALETKDMRK